MQQYDQRQRELVWAKQKYEIRVVHTHTSINPEGLRDRLNGGASTGQQDEVCGQPR